MTPVPTLYDGGALVIPDGFKLVYQGGHHSVYCNGVEHIHEKGGGWTRMSKPYMHEPRYRCNCQEFRSSHQS